MSYRLIIKLFFFGMGLLFLLPVYSQEDKLFQDEMEIKRKGEQLFKGAASLKGFINGHTDFLRPELVRCVNCHTVEKEENFAFNATTSIALSKLSLAGLSKARFKEGEPPSRYTVEKFCRLLHSGVDAAEVIVVREMPRYKLMNQECQALWLYLIDF